MDKPTVGMTVRRSGARLRSFAKAHSPLHVLLWQSREAQSALLAAAAAQKTLFNDIASWASSENRALTDVCSCVADLSCLYTAAMAQLALAYKSFRKEMGMVLEGERRSDAAQRKLNEAENKRIKLRRQVLRAQNRTQTQGEPRRSGDFTSLQTQLAEAERSAEKAHMEACATAREQECVKLVVVKAALSKLSEAHLKLVTQTKTIFDGSRELCHEIPEPPPPGDPVSCIRYSGYDKTKVLVQRIKSQVPLTTSSPSRPASTSTPLTSPNTSSLIWSPEGSSGRCGNAHGHSPSAPLHHHHEPPPPYNMSYLSSDANHTPRSSLSTNNSLGLESSGIYENGHSHQDDDIEQENLGQNRSAIYENFQQDCSNISTSSANALSSHFNASVNVSVLSELEENIMPSSSRYSNVT